MEGSLIVMGIGKFFRQILSDNGLIGIFCCFSLFK